MQSGRNAKEFHQLEGNHEVWMREARSMDTYRAIAKDIDDWYFERWLPKAVKFTHFGRYEDYGNRCWIDIGKLRILHGYVHTINFLTRTHVDLNSSFIRGDIHTIESKTFRSFESPHMAWCIGCLCYPQASYHRNRPNGWGQSVAEVIVRPDNRFHVNIHTIVKGVLYYGRKRFVPSELKGF